MKTLRKLAACCALAAALTNVQTATAWVTGGYVFCDSNQSEQIDSGDKPLTGVFVVVTNVSGTFSNSTFTATPDGSFVMDLPAAADTYVLYAHPLTLPSDALVILPAGGAFTFTLDGVNTNFIGNFLIASASCTNAPPPPPPPPQTNSCGLKACGTICGGKKPQYVFGGQVIPACGSTNGDSGSWDVVAVCAKLHFEGCVFEIDNCGDVQDGSCSRKYIEFQGAGTLKGINGCKANNGLVYFWARAEDGCGNGCPDRLYVRVYSTDGVTLLLISGDMANPANIVTVPISTGALVISSVACPCSGGDKGGDDHGGKGDGKGDKGGKDDKGGKGDKGGKAGDCSGDKGGKGDKSGGGDKGGKGDKNGKGNDCAKSGQDKKDGKK